MSRSTSPALIRQPVVRGAGLGQGRVRQTAALIATTARRNVQRPRCRNASRPYLLTFDADGKPTDLHADRYEFWLYRQVRKRFQSGELYSTTACSTGIFPTSWFRWMRRPPCWRRSTSHSCGSPVDAQLDALGDRAARKWLAFNRELKQGKLTHLEYDKDTQKLTGASPRARTRRRARRRSLRATAVLRCRRRVSLRQQPVPVPVGADALAATLCEGRRRRQPDGGHHRAGDEPRQPGHGTHQRHPVPRLESAYQQYLRHATLHAANDCISNAIAALPIFPYYSFDLDVVRCRRWAEIRRRAADRESALLAQILWARKGVVAYTLLCNHVPLNGYLIGAHDYEAHHVSTSGIRNTSDIVPTAITGDMHSVNKANFAILHWFGLRFEPRFTDLGDPVEGTLQCRRSGAVRSTA